MTQSNHIIARTIARSARLFKPPPDMTVTQWADEYRYLSSEASALAGKYSSAFTPYQREPQDMMTVSYVEGIALKWGAQLGKTEVSINCVGYGIDQDPGPMLAVLPTEKMARTWSTDRVTPMIRDTPALSKIINVKANKTTGNSVLYKAFPGGHLTLVGSHSSSDLAMRPIRWAFLDESSRFKKTTGDDGSPKEQAKKRMETFGPYAKFLETSSPTIKGRCEIDETYQAGSQASFHVKCPHCDEYQKLVWSQMQWNANEAGEIDISTVCYVCEINGCVLIDSDKPLLLESGKWVHKYPDRAIKSYHLSSLYSPFLSWSKLVDKFKEMYKLPDKLKVFVQTYLAEVWEDEREIKEQDWSDYANRREPYKAQVPTGVIMLTASCDVQEDRCEIEVKGWGLDEENWSIEKFVVTGRPNRKETCNALDDILFNTKFLHESGVEMGIHTRFMDSGHFTQEVYSYVRPRQTRRLFAIKGASTSGVPTIAKVSRRKEDGIRLIFIGTDTTKDVFFDRLNEIELPGPGFCHFPDHYDDEYFEQLTAEVKIEKYERGKRKTVWEHKSGHPNENIDLNVYNYAAFKYAGVNMPMEKKRLEARILKLLSSTQQTPPPKRRKIVRKKQSSFVNRHKDV